MTEININTNEEISVIQKPYQYKIWAEAVEESLMEMEKAGVTIVYPEQDGFRASVESMYEELKVAQPELYAVIDQIRKQP